MRAGAELQRRVVHAAPAQREQVLRRFGELLMREMGAAGVRMELPPALATAIVGGINELVLEALEEDRAGRLTELFPSATALIRAFLAPRPTCAADPAYRAADDRWGR